MDPIEIVLIIIGIIIITISCFLIDRSQNSGKSTDSGMQSRQNPVSEQEMKQIKDKINELFNEISEETVVRTDDSLSRLSNEKIMAVNEFSDQILEKIKRNHEEVVFLYNMLNEKDKELKSAMREIDTSKKKAQEILESKREAAKTLPVKKAASSSPVSQKAELPTQTIKVPKPEIQNMQAPMESAANETGSNSNSQILSFYSQGKSIMEISKLLGLGQGEVKLVIDLFKGKK